MHAFRLRLLLAVLVVMFAVPALTGVSVSRTHPDEFFQADTTATESAPDTAKADSGSWVVSEPHGPSHTISFTTEEGTWINVDVSPDGKQVVFDILGDLYLVPITGGKAVRITSGLAYDNQPRFSPDGKRVLFTSDRGGSDNLWTAATDGSDLRPLTSDSKHEVNSGDWSPDGTYVVARKRITDRSSIGQVELWLYHVMGGTGVQVTEKDKISDASCPVFSPDGRWIYFAYRSGRYRYNANVYAGIWQVRGYDRETGNLRRFTDGYGGSGRVAVSPDGKTLSYIRRDREKTLLVLQDIQSGLERVLFDGLEPDMMENFANTGTYPGYDWTPDGKSIVISYGGGIHRISVEDGTASPIPFSADVNQDVVDALRFQQNISPDTFRVRMVSWPVLAPGGKDLVFSALGRLYRMPSEGGTPSVLGTEGPRAYAPSFAPQRNRLAYVSWSDTEGGQVWVMDDYRRSRRVTEVPGQYSNPVFSPDGSKLVFLRGNGASQRGSMEDELQLDIFWAPARGGEAHYVVSVDNRGSAVPMPRLAWSPDGERIYYNEDTGSGDKARTVLASIRPDGTDRREHVKVQWADAIVPSPNGKWIVFNRLHQGFLAALPHLGKDPIELSGDKGPVPAYKFSDEGADWLNWSPGGDEVTWGFGPNFYRIPLEEIQAAWAADKEKAARKTFPKTENEDENSEEKKDDDKGKVHPDTLEVNLEVPRAKPHGTYALQGARLITMNGDEVIESGTVVVTDDRIAAVGSDGDVRIPDGAKVFDMTGKTIIPGLVDVHAHLHYDAMDIIPENIDSYYANLAYGVTTTHDPSASTYAVFTQHEMVEAGVTVGPRIFSTGFILYGAEIQNMAPVESLEDARHHIRRLKTLGAFTVKSYMQPRREQRQWIIEAAREESVMVVPEGGGFLELNMGMILDGHTGIEHALPVAPIYKDVVNLMARSGTGYTPTLLVAYGGLSGENWFYQKDEVWKHEKLLRFLPRGPIDARSRRRSMAPDDDFHHIHVAEGCKKVVDAGGRVQLGAHGQLQGLGAHWELWALGQGGMTNMQALRCATLFGAEYIGLDESIGSITSGKLADLVVLDRNPLEDLHNSNSVSVVIKNGDMYDGDDMNRIWPSAVPRPEFFWQARGTSLRDLGPEGASRGKR